MRNNYNEERIKQLLNQMPQIKDQQNKEELYFKLADHENTENNSVTTRGKRTWLIPSIATFAVGILLVIMLQSAVFEYYSQDEAKISHNRQSTEESSNFESGNSGGQENEAFFDRATQNNSSEQESLKPGEYSSLQQAPVSYVAYKDHPDITVIHAAGMTESIQHLIPITIIDTSGGMELDEYYNQINSLIRDKEGVSLFPFDGITFTLDESADQVLLKISDDYVFPNGSAMASMFDKVLSAMFGPLEIKEVVVEGDTSNINQLGPIRDGNWKLTEQKNISYKYYKYNNSSQELLTAASINEFDSIHQALRDMQRDEPDFDLNASIPRDTNFTVSIIEDQVRVSFTDSVNFGNNLFTIKMVEALLMTVKSFGYNQLFIDIPVDQVGTYDLRKSIPVPDGVNPIYLH